MPYISVIIPTYNRSRHITSAVASVLEQTYTDFELIIVNDGSTDETLSQLESISDKRVTIISQANLGVSAARNRGIDVSQGEWVTFLDSDDTWYPEKLQIQIDFHQGSKKTLISQTQEKWIRNGKFVNPMQKHLKPSGYIFPQSLHLCTITPSSAMIHKSVLEVTGLFDEKLAACEDYDLWLRITADHPVELIDQPLLIKTGGHADQLSAKYAAMDRFRIYSLLKLLSSGKLNPAQRKEATSVCQKKIAILGNGLKKRGKDPSRLNQLAQIAYEGISPFKEILEELARLLLEESAFY